MRPRMDLAHLKNGTPIASGLAGVPLQGGSLDVVGVYNMADIEQFASKVVNFSSQYGTAMSSSYTAINLASSPNIYPNYGDYTDAFVLVSYKLNMCGLQRSRPTVRTPLESWVLCYVANYHKICSLQNLRLQHALIINLADICACSRHSAVTTFFQGHVSVSENCANYIKLI